MTPKELIDQLYKENSTFSSERFAASVANLVNTVSTDIYTESERFIFELIQNADDSAENLQNEVHLNFLENYLIVSHNGALFDNEDVIALSSAGASTKKSDPNKTGYKGIGFKSVFGKSQNVAIFSGNFQFRFDAKYHKTILPWQMIPIWTELEELPNEVQNHLKKYSYSVSTIIQIENGPKLQADLNNVLLSGQLLLFLRHTKKITISKNETKILTISKDHIKSDTNFDLTNLLRNDLVVSSWIVKIFDKISIPEKTKLELKNDPKTPDKLKEIALTDISFAVKVEGNKIKPLAGEESLVFTYLPTKVSEFGFPFLVNGSFVTNAARETLNQDSYWNKWLFELIGEKILDWIEQLSSSPYRYQVFRILPKNYDTINNLLKTSFNESFSKHIPLKNIVCTSSEALKKTSEVIFDKTGLSRESFIDKESIVEFLNEQLGSEFGIDCFVNHKLEDSNKLKAIGVKTFELDDFQSFFKSKHFTLRHKIEDNFKLIEYCKGKSDADKDGIWLDRLRELPFIFDNSDKLANPETGICFPIGIASTELGNIPVINEKVYLEIQKTPIIYDWLKTLGVKEPSQTTYVTNVIIPNLKTPDYITIENYLPITRYLFRLFNEKKLTEEMLENLRELPLKTKSINIEFKAAQFCFLSNGFRPSLQIEGVISEVSLVSEEYIDAQGKDIEWNLFLRAIKVKEKIEIETITANNSLPALRVATSQEWVDECYNRRSEFPLAFGFEDSNIIRNVNIPTFLNFTSKNYKYSKLFWENLIGQYHNPIKLIEGANYRYGIGRGKHSFGFTVENYFSWFVKTQTCIPTSIDKLMKAEDVFINDSDIKTIAGKYLPVFDLDLPLSPEWKQVFNFKSILTLEDYLKILENIVLKAEDEERTQKPGLKRIGQIYNRLATILPALTNDQKAIISNWSKTNRLLSTDRKFEPTDQLKWITIEGFNNKSDKLKTIELPDNCKTEMPDFKELMTLFQIHVIDAFIPTFKEERLELTLKNRLEEVLPYFAIIVAKRKVEDENKEYIRLYEIVNSYDFLTASEINLSFSYAGELIEGPSEIIFEKDKKLYFKGKWKSERTLLSLIKKLASILEVKNLNEELRFLLLEQNQTEINEWMTEMGVTLSSIPIKKIFGKTLFESSTTTITPKEYKNLTNINVVSEPATSYGTEENSPMSENGNRKDEADINVAHESFTPVISAREFDASEIKPEFKRGEIVPILKEHVAYTEIKDDTVKHEIGRWSEEFVSVNLPKWGNYSSIIWENEKEESGKPYDFKLIENGIEIYIEVKGTPSANKDLIYLSQNEFNLMFNKKENYRIIRIYNAGKPNINIVFIENPADQIVKGTIQVALKI